MLLEVIMTKESHMSAFRPLWKHICPTVADFHFTIHCKHSTGTSLIPPTTISETKTHAHIFTVSCPPAQCFFSPIGGSLTFQAHP